MAGAAVVFLAPNGDPDLVDILGVSQTVGVFGLYLYLHLFTSEINQVIPTHSKDRAVSGKQKATNQKIRN